MRRHRFLFVTGVALGAAAALACNSISGLDQDFSLAQSPTTPTNEGGADGPPTSTDGTTTPPADGPIVVLPDAGCPKPLPASTLFCDDFEEVASPPPLYGWTRRETKGGDPGVQTPFGLNDSRGLRSVAQGTCAGNSCTVVLWRNVANGFDRGSTLTLSLYFRVAAMGTDYAVIGAIQVAAAGSGFEYGIAAHKSVNCPGGGLCIDQNQPRDQPNFQSAVALSANTWHRAEIVITRDNADGYAGRVVLDGTTTLDQRPNAFAWTGAPIQPTSVEVGVGAFFSGQPNSPTETHVDNVVVTRTP